MHSYLASNPEIFMAQKEMHCFGSDLRFATNFYRRTEQEYLAEFDAWDGQRRAGETSVWYLFSSQAAAEIKAFNPNARVIIMLREPAEMLHSLYGQFLSDGNEDLPTFREALAAQDDRCIGRQISRHAYFSQGLIYHEVVRYTEQIRRYFEIFGRERVQVIIYDDFAAKTDVVYRGVLDFLGVDSTRILDSFQKINGNKSVRSSVLRDILCDPLVRGSAISARSWLPRPIFKALQKVESQFLKWNYRSEKRPQLDLDLLMALKLEFTPEVERLSALLGRDLTHWNSINRRQPEAVGAIPACV